MLDSTIATMGWVVSNLLIAGQQPSPMGNDNFTAAPSGTFRTGDGLINIAANKQEQFVALASLIGRDDLLDDERFAGREARKRHRRELTVEIEEGLAGRGASDWEAVLNDVGVPAGRVLGVSEALGLEQVRGRELVYEFEGKTPCNGNLAVVRGGYRLDGAAAAITRPPPRLGEHTAEVLTDLGYDQFRIERLRAEKAI
jgi:crotonobetainyl-CoA:carnitine CoA-transferase CaiB-like acyl-CoA transferase